MMIRWFAAAAAMITSVTATTALFAPVERAILLADPPTEAPASYQLVTNGFTSQEDFLANLAQFSQDATETGGDDPGLGPTFNGTSCKSCHLNPSVGGGMSRFELRAGKLGLDGSFIAPPGGTLVRQMAVDAGAQQHVPEGYFTTRRRSTSLFGLGFIEVIRDADILAVRDAQPADMRGVATMVPATTAIDNEGKLTQVLKVGRFGWKCQQATLLDFAADAQVNEKSVTNPINPKEPPGIDGLPLDDFKKTADPEDEPGDTPDTKFGKDVVAYARFMRSLKFPPPSRQVVPNPDIEPGMGAFRLIGCAVCHVETWTTAPVGSTPTGLQPVDAARGNKLLKFVGSDFLLHDVGTGQTEVVQGGGPATRQMLRTPMLAGVRTVPEMGHDGRWTTLEQAIQEHGGQATQVVKRYNGVSTDGINLTADQRRQLKVAIGTK